MKIIKTECCGNCPNKTPKMAGLNKYFCYELSKKARQLIAVDLLVIHPDCPLPDEVPDEG